LLSANAAVEATANMMNMAVLIIFLIAAP
jgi:hypothetical protein